MDDLHSSRHLYCSLFSPRYLEKEKRTKYCNYEIVITSKVPQHTSLWYSWFKYFFRDSHYGKRYVDCRPCHSLRGKLWAREHNGAQGVPGFNASPPSPHLRDPIFTKKNPEPSTWKPAIHSVESRIQDQWRIQERGPVDPFPLIFTPNWGPKGRKKFFWDRVPPFVRVWMTGPPLPPLYKGLVPPLKTTDYSETEKVTL